MLFYELDAHSGKVTVCLRIDDSPAPRGYISAFFGRPTRKSVFLHP